jgi:signal transduction histidine kinase
MLLRIAQEFLQNSLRHASCHNIVIRSTYDQKGLGLLLEDDGKGFEYPGGIAGNGIGISNMKKRALIIGAELTLQSSPGKGTSLDIFIPAETISQQP